MKYLQLLQKKSNFLSSRKQPYVPLLPHVDIQIRKHVFKQKRDCKLYGEFGKCKAKAIQVDLGIFTHIPVYSRIFRNYSGIFYILCNFGIFRALVYSESWHIQYQKHIQNPVISKPMAYSEPETYPESWVIQNPGIFRTRGILRTLSNIYDEAL